MLVLTPFISLLPRGDFQPEMILAVTVAVTLSRVRVRARADATVRALCRRASAPPALFFS
jgi:hypothetical protein